LFVRHTLNELLGLTQRNGFVKCRSRRFHLPSLRDRPPRLVACDDCDPAPPAGVGILFFAMCLPFQPTQRHGQDNSGSSDGDTQSRSRIPEGLIGSIRRQCTDHLIVFNA
jgi:hypothetical protein